MSDIIKTRRSIRKFEDREIEKDKLKAILQGALTAPSSRGKRPWNLVVVTEKERLNQLSQCREVGSSFLANASACIVIVGDPTVTDVWIEDTSIIATILLLEAHGQGLGACWCQVRNRNTKDGGSSSDFIKSILDIPEQYSVECIIGMGYPDEKKKPYEVDELPYDKIRYGRW